METTLLAITSKISSYLSTSGLSLVLEIRAGGFN